METNKTRKEKKPFQYVLDSDKAHKLCPDDCVVEAMQGYRRIQDFYIFVPIKGIFFRSANSGRYKNWVNLLFIDGRFIGACSWAKQDKVRALYNKGFADEAEEYSRGERLWKETSLGGRKINRYKEAARESHRRCDMSGSAGHEARQMIRRQILSA